MNPIQIIAALRKFGNYLAGLFPWFVTMVNFVTGLVGGPERALLSLS